MSVPLEHFIKRDVHLVERALAGGPDVRVVGVVAGGIDQRLRPALHILRRSVVESEQLLQAFRRERCREIPDQIRARPFFNQVRQLLAALLVEGLRPDVFHHIGFEHALPLAALAVVLRVVAAQHRMPHGTDLKRVLLVG